MLVLTRKPEQSIVVGIRGWAERFLTVTVLQISGEKVRLGFEARDDVAVHRWEVWEKIRAQRPKNITQDPIPAKASINP